MNCSSFWPWLFVNWCSLSVRPHCLATPPHFGFVLFTVPWSLIRKRSAYPQVPFGLAPFFCKYKSIHVRFTFTGFQWSMKPLLDSTKIIQILTFDLPEQKRSSYQACYFNKEVFLNKLIHPYINGGIYTHTHSRVRRQSTQWKRSKLLSLPFR